MIPTRFHLNDASILKATIVAEYADAYKVLVPDTGKERSILKQDIIRLNDDFLGLKRVRTYLRKNTGGLEIILHSMKRK